jgi:hypothetical protein
MAEKVSFGILEASGIFLEVGTADRTHNHTQRRYWIMEGPSINHPQAGREEA